MSGKHLIPNRDAEFDVFFKNIVDYVLARVLIPQPVWTHIPALGCGVCLQTP
jgi:hypothetical protein